MKFLSYRDVFVDSSLWFLEFPFFVCFAKLLFFFKRMLQKALS